MAVEAVVSTVVGKLSDILIQETTFHFDVKDKAEWIERELRKIQFFLQDAEEKQENNLNVKNWVNDIRDVAFDADDVFEKYIFYKTQQKERNFLKKCAFIFYDLHTRHLIGMEIKRIKIKITDITNSRYTYGLEIIGGGSKEASSSSIAWLREKRRTSPHQADDETQVVGLEKDINELKTRLIGQPLRRCVISIVAMGGQGKTTLAQKVYNCDAVKNHFQVCAWVFVSQEYNTKDLLHDVAKKFMGLRAQEMNEEDLKEHIRGFLKQKRYLVVMDDVWRIDFWELLNDVFPNTKNGSRVVFTTRNKEVALHADPVSIPLELAPLSEDDSWVLFTKKVLLVEEITLEQCFLPKELEEVKTKIVKKCGGLPLAIIVLGGFLSRKRKSISEWTKVLDRINWQLNQDQTPCSQILALSYNDLPFYLKPCFQYLGIFPEDYEISKRNLIKLWIVEGFVQKRGDEIAEDIAEDYLEELVDRCMVQVARRSHNGSIKTCRVHDLLRDLAISKAAEVKCFQIHGSGNSSSTCYSTFNKVRRIVFHYTNSNFSVEQFYDKHIRSLFSFDSMNQELLNRSVHMGFGMLKVLHLINRGRGRAHIELPKAAGKLIHLRYLLLRRIRVQRFSSTIGNLRNLQILNIDNNDLIKCGRDAMSNMVHLRHFQVRNSLEGIRLSFPDRSLHMDFALLIDPPRWNGNVSSYFSSIRNLLTLWGIEIDNKSLVKDGWDKYTNLRKLGLYINVELESQIEAFAGWITKLDHLESLRLEFRNKIHGKYIFSRNYFNLYKLCLGGVVIENLLSDREFPSNLSHLTLSRCILGEETWSILGKLPKLKFLYIWLSDLKEKCAIFLSGGFPQLENLDLIGLHGLEEWKVEEGALPCLRELSISHCSNLKALPDGLQRVTTLQKLRILTGSNVELEARVKPNEGEDWGKIAHVPNIKIMRR